MPSGTTAGALLGSSTITTYVESASGVAEGGKSGLTSFFVGLMFILSIFLAPIFLLIPSAATSGALVMVGVLMIDSFKKIELEDISSHCRLYHDDYDGILLEYCRWHLPWYSELCIDQDDGGQVQGSESYAVYPEHLPALQLCFRLIKRQIKCRRQSASRRLPPSLSN